MRQIVSGLIGVVLLASLAACGGETEQPSEAAPKAASTQSAAEPAPAPEPAQAPEPAAEVVAEVAEKADMPKAEDAQAMAEEKMPALAKDAEERAADGADAATDGTVHEVRMLNSNPDNPREKMVYIPRVLRIAPGDTVRFLPESPGHNTASTKGMVPDGFEGWKSRINKTFEVTLTDPGIYGYNCTPHKTAGMVGLIVVEGDGMLDNLDAAKAVRQAGKARGAWADIWAEAEAAGALTP